MKLPVFGDVHGSWDRVNVALSHETDPGGICLCVGDLSTYEGPAEGHTMLFVAGNHEDCSALHDLAAGEGHPRLHLIQVGDIHRLSDGTSVAGLPGIFSERAWRGDIERPTYWSRPQIHALAELPETPTILLSHEAPLEIGLVKGRRHLGHSVVTRIIDALQPPLAFCGHHHALHEGAIGATRVICLPYAYRGYAVVDTDTLSVRIVTATMPNPDTGYRFPWEIADE